MGGIEIDFIIMLKKIGLTGGIKSGKSAVGSFWKKMGAKLISADEIGHDLLLPDTLTAKEVLNLFGVEILDREGKIVRNKVRKIVFTNKEALQKFNSIIHPVLIDRLKKNIIALENSTKSESSPDKNPLVVDAALIFEWNIEKEFDVIVTVEAPEDKRRERIKFLGWSDEEIQGCLASQYSESYRRDHADFIIDNKSSMEELDNKSKEIWKKIKISQ